MMASLRRIAALTCGAFAAFVVLGLLFSPPEAKDELLALVLFGCAAAAASYFLWEPSQPASTFSASNSTLQQPERNATPSNDARMSRTIRREVSKRGAFGWLFLLLFFAFNVVMLVWAISYTNLLSALSTGNEYERTGAAIGGLFGYSFLAFVWVAGAFVTGLLAFFTRGRKTIIEETVKE